MIDKYILEKVMEMFENGLTDSLDTNVEDGTPIDNLFTLWAVIKDTVLEHLGV